MKLLLLILLHILVWSDWNILLEFLPSCVLLPLRCSSSGDQWVTSPPYLKEAALQHKAASYHLRVFSPFLLILCLFLLRKEVWRSSFCGFVCQISLCIFFLYFRVGSSGSYSPLCGWPRLPPLLLFFLARPPDSHSFGWIMVICVGRHKKTFLH